MLDEIQKLIKETEQWLEYHRQNHNHIDAAACAVRLTALKQAYEIVRKNYKSQLTLYSF